MGWPSLVAIAIALGVDAFAVAIVAGLTLELLTKRRLFRLAFHFGLFQSMMLAAGWLVGNALQRYIAAFDHWMAFGLLSFVGFNMIRGALRHEDEKRAPNDPTTGWDLVLLSVATSIDALAVGLSFAFLGSAIVAPALIVGIVAAAMTLIGMAIGRRIGEMWGSRIEIAGGLVLIVIGLKIVWQHTFA